MFLVYAQRVDAGAGIPGHRGFQSPGGSVNSSTVPALTMKAPPKAASSPWAYTPSSILLLQHLHFSFLLFNPSNTFAKNPCTQFPLKQLA